MGMIFRNVAVLAKTESTYGTDSTPVGTTDAMLVKGAQPQVYMGDRVSRDLQTGVIGAQSEINVGPHAAITFQVEIAGAGTAGTAPKYGPLLKACGMSETVSAGVSVTYAPVSSAFSSVTIYYFIDGQKHIIKGARGTVRFTLARGQIPVMEFTFTGLYTRPTAVANPALTLTGFQAPVAVTKANTTPFTLHGYAAFCESFAVDVGNQIVYRNLIGYEGVELTNRNVRGSTVIEATTIATKDWFAASEAHAGVTLAAVALTHGTTAGNIVQLTGPAVQLGNIALGESDGIVTYSMDTVFTPTGAGNDEFTVVVK